MSENHWSLEHNNFKNIGITATFLELLFMGLLKQKQKPKNWP